jgi:hypothetical protein
MMPKRIADYTPVLSLLSTARLSSVPGTFNIQNNNIEMYGFSLWVQNAAASLYPLVQQLELILRNSIDKAARSRFGDKWWDVIKFDTTKDNHSKFRDCIKEAEKSLKRSWRDRETARQGLAHHSLLTTPPPVFSHDDIIATTNFSTWESVLLDALHTENNAEKADYLWPNSLPKAFRRLSEIDIKPIEARRKLINLLKEIRDYRNRLFHHDCIWIKSKSVDAKTAIDSIREKINLIEKLITAISPITCQALNAWGMFANARRVCSIEELNIYTNLNYQTPDTAEPGVLDKLFQQTKGGKQSVPMVLNNNSCCILFKMR